MSSNSRPPPSLTRRGAPPPAATVFMSSRSRLARSSSAKALNICAASGFGSFSASFSNVLYASTVYWNIRPSCCSVSWAFGVSTAVIVSSLNRCHFHDHIAEQFRLAAQPVRLFELLVRLVRRRRREAVPSLHDLDPASPARAVAAAHVTDAHAHLAGA